jgi:hypothetical protein
MLSNVVFSGQAATGQHRARIGVNLPLPGCRPMRAKSAHETGRVAARDASEEINQLKIIRARAP